MTEPLRIKSARDAFELVLGPPDSRSGEGYFPVVLTGPVGGRVQAYDDHLAQLVEFFESMAIESMGWSGEKSWESLESHVVLRATIDQLGHVYLQAILRNCDDPADWRLETTIQLEAGQLEFIAKVARRVFGASAAV
jgi:hypothetical protein